MKPAHQVNPGENSDLSLSSPNKSPSAVNDWKGLSLETIRTRTWIVSKQVQFNTIVIKTARCDKYEGICVGVISQDIQWYLGKYNGAVQGI